MFPFVIQMNEIVTERELKLRKALEAMGLHDTAYWLSWHLFQTTMTMLFGFFIWLFGLIFQFALFKKNGEDNVLFNFSVNPVSYCQNVRRWRFVCRFWHCVPYILALWPINGISP